MIGLDMSFHVSMLVFSRGCDAFFSDSQGPVLA